MLKPVRQDKALRSSGSTVDVELPSVRYTSSIPPTPNFFEILVVGDGRADHLKVVPRERPCTPVVQEIGGEVDTPSPTVLFSIEPDLLGGNF